jgi:hypothetical protein
MTAIAVAGPRNQYFHTSTSQIADDCHVARLAFFAFDGRSSSDPFPAQQMLHRPRLEKRSCLSPSHTSEDDRWLTRPTLKDDDNEDYSPLHRGR